MSLLTGLQLASMSSLPKSVVDEARELANQISQQKLVNNLLWGQRLAVSTLIAQLVGMGKKVKFEHIIFLKISHTSRGMVIT